MKISEQFFIEARDIVFQKFRAIQMLDRPGLDRAFDWPPDELIKETALRLAAEATVDQLQKALEMLYDKYEDGNPCTENGDEYGSPLGNCVQLSAEEENRILALIPAVRTP